MKVIVIGSGILGASAAYHLAKAGVEVTVIDGKHSGQATDAAAGIICPWISQRRNKPWYNLVKAGARFYPNLIKMLEEDGEMETGYQQVGAISLHDDIEKLRKMKERTEKRKEDAPEIGEVQLLSPSETKEKFPLVGERYHSVFVSGGARVNGRALRDALLSGAKKYGARHIRSDAKLLYKTETEISVKLESEQLKADKVIVTGGAWTKELLMPLGINFNVKPQKAQIVHLEIQQTQTQEWPVVMPPNNQYILAFEGGKIVVGATHEDEAGFDTRVTAGGLNEILSKALEVMPKLSDATVVETRVGFRPFTPEFLPVIGELPQRAGVFVANGLGASGLTSGPFLGAEIARLVLSEETELDLSAYDVMKAIEAQNEE